MHIRDATVDDINVLVDNNYAMAEETESLQLDRPSLVSGVATVFRGGTGARYFVVEIEGTVVGQLMITKEWSDWRNAYVWWIQSVYVAPHARGRGVYKALYAHVQALGREAGIAGIRLYVDERNTRAQAVYTQLGMQGEHYRVFEAMSDS